MPTFTYTDDELLAMIERQPLPITAGRFSILLNNRISKDTAYRRLKAMTERGKLLSRKMRHRHHNIRQVTVYGNGEQMAALDREGINGLWKREGEWYG
tara:strand:- start:2242 stop:2535 length:294 start_codon:yes stop_codon:yes gene_type:complete